jgi:hypothetical protein
VTLLSEITAWAVGRAGREGTLSRALAVETSSPMPITYQPGQDRFRTIWSDEIDWKPFPAFPPEARLAVLIGDPAQAGPYVIRVKVSAGPRPSALSIRSIAQSVAQGRTI